MGKVGHLHGGFWDSDLRRIRFNTNAERHKVMSVMVQVAKDLSKNLSVFVAEGLVKSVDCKADQVAELGVSEVSNSPILLHIAGTGVEDVSSSAFGVEGALLEDTRRLNIQNHVLSIVEAGDSTSGLLAAADAMRNTEAVESDVGGAQLRSLKESSSRRANDGLVGIQPALRLWLRLEGSQARGFAATDVKQLSDAAEARRDTQVVDASALSSYGSAVGKQSGSGRVNLSWLICERKRHCDAAANPLRNAIAIHKAVASGGGASLEFGSGRVIQLRILGQEGRLLERLLNSLLLHLAVAETLGNAKSADQCKAIGDGRGGSVLEGGSRGVE